MEAQSKFAQLYQGNRCLVNAAISIGGLAILTYATMAIVKAVRKPSNQGGGFNGGGTNGGGNAGTGNTGNTGGNFGVSPTISNTKATSLANKLEDAMDHYGTDEQAIIEAFDEMQNDADVALVYQKFGLRPYLDTIFGGGSPVGLDSWFGNYDDLDLAAWMRAEVDCEDVGDACSKMASAGYDV